MSSVLFKCHFLTNKKTKTYMTNKKHRFFLSFLLFFLGIMYICKIYVYTKILAKSILSNLCTKIISLILLRTTKYYSSRLRTTYYKYYGQYYKVLLRTTNYCSSTTKCYSNTAKYYYVLQSTTPVLLRTTKYYFSTTPYYKGLLQ